MAIEGSKGILSVLASTIAIEGSKGILSVLASTIAIEGSKGVLSTIVNKDLDEFVPSTGRRRQIINN